MMSRMLTEHQFQNWRVIAVDTSDQEHLICLDKNFTQIRDAYIEAFHEVLTEEEQKAIKRISLQRWSGMADRGQWITRNLLPIPALEKAIAS